MVITRWNILSISICVCKFSLFQLASVVILIKSRFLFLIMVVVLVIMTHGLFLFVKKDFQTRKWTCNKESNIWRRYPSPIKFDKRPQRPSSRKGKKRSPTIWLWCLWPSRCVKRRQTRRYVFTRLRLRKHAIFLENYWCLL